jgi:hypothetical protein
LKFFHRQKNPFGFESFSKCQWCGQAYPSSQIFYNPRWGWQCQPCWDGLISRDQILQPIFPYEGTRKTPAPVVDSLLEGIAPGSLYQSYDYLLVDRVTGSIYTAHVPPITIGPGGLIFYSTAAVITLTLVASTTDPTYRGIRINNGWDIYVRNGAIATEQPPLDALGIVDGICDFGPVASLCTVFMADRITGETFLVDFSQEPPTLTLASTDTSPVFDAVAVNDGWFLVVMGVGSLFSTLTPPSGNIFANDCITDHVFITSTGENEGGGVTPPTAPNCVTDTLLVHEIFETEICPTPNLLHFEDFETELCETPTLLIFDNFES